MASKNSIATAYVRFKDSYDDILRATSILEAATIYLNGESPFKHSTPDSIENGRYLLALYHQELEVYLETFKTNLEQMKTYWDLSP